LSFHDELQQRLGPGPSSLLPGISFARHLITANTIAAKKVNRSLEPDLASTKLFNIEAKACAF
jgi:hypothetical protein